MLFLIYKREPFKLYVPYWFFSVVFQEFNANVDTENYVIKGNDAILKCDIPSFVTDLVDISGWIDSSGNEYYYNSGKKYWLFFIKSLS